MEHQYIKPLPQCDGPKLKPFHDPKAIVLFHRLISDKDAEGNCAHVFEVSIGSTKYALKNLITDDLLEAHCDPFFRECRAYGRLEEKKLNGKVAARCYGYITIPSEGEKQFERRFGIREWDRPDPDYTEPISERRPFRAIVKELILKDVPLNGRVADRILRDMKRMRRCAMTRPYWLFQIRPKYGEMIKCRELYKWQEMVEEKQLDVHLRAVRNKEYCKKLRRPKAKAKRARR